MELYIIIHFHQGRWNLTFISSSQPRKLEKHPSLLSISFSLPGLYHWNCKRWCDQWHSILHNSDQFLEPPLTHTGSSICTVDSSYFLKHFFYLPFRTSYSWLPLVSGGRWQTQQSIKVNVRVTVWGATTEHFEGFHEQKCQRWFWKKVTWVLPSSYHWALRCSFRVWVVFSPLHEIFVSQSSS